MKKVILALGIINPIINNKSFRELFKARKILMVWTGRGKAIFIRKIEMCL